MEEFKPKRKNSSYPGTDKAGAPRRSPAQVPCSRSPRGRNAAHGAA